MDDLTVTDYLFAETILGGLAMDNLTLSDVARTASAFARSPQDVVAVADELVPGLLSDRLSTEALALTDGIAAGLWRDVEVNDTIVVTEAWAVASDYARGVSDEAQATDGANPWIPSMSHLQVELEGSAKLAALLLERTSDPLPLNQAPSKTVSLPKEPPPLERYYVVDPDPRDR